MEDNLVLIAFLALTCLAVLCLYLFFGKYAFQKAKQVSWPKLLAGNALVLFLLASLALLGGEVYFRFCYDTTDSFTVTKTSQRWFERHFHQNNAGFRDNVDYSMSKSPWRRRVSFIGDSFTVGHGIADVDRRFANRIRALHAEWDIQVIAQTGLDTGGELNLLNTLFSARYECDQVVLVYCLNDIDDADPRWAERYAKIDERWRNHRPGFVFEHSYLFNTLYYRAWVHTFPELAGYYRCDHEAYLGAPWQTQRRWLQAMRELVQAHGGRLAVVTFPYMHLMGPAYEFKDVHRQLDEFWRSIDVPHLDLLPVFMPYPPRKLMVNAHDAHPNELAHALAADAMTPFLERLLK